jgi:hypothetical protein
LREIAGDGSGSDLAQGSGVYEVRVARDDFAESGFVAVFGVIAEQLDV